MVVLDRIIGLIFVFVLMICGYTQPALSNAVIEYKIQNHPSTAVQSNGVDFKPLTNSSVGYIFGYNDVASGNVNAYVNKFDGNGKSDLGYVAEIYDSNNIKLLSMFTDGIINKLPLSNNSLHLIGNTKKPGFGGLNNGEAIYYKMLNNGVIALKKQYKINNAVLSITDAEEISSTELVAVGTHRDLNSFVTSVILLKISKSNGSVVLSKILDDGLGTVFNNPLVKFNSSTGHLFVGATQSNSREFFVFKADLNGNVSFSRKYRIPDSTKTNVQTPKVTLNNMIIDNSGNLVVVGSSNYIFSNLSGSTTTSFLMRINSSNGNILSYREFDAVTSNFNFQHMTFNSLLQTSDNNYVVGAEAIYSDGGATQEKDVLMKISQSNNSILWARRYDLPSGTDRVALHSSAGDFYSASEKFSLSIMDSAGRGVCTAKDISVTSFNNPVGATFSLVSIFVSNVTVKMKDAIDLGKNVRIEPDIFCQ